MKIAVLPPDTPLGKQLRPLSETFSALTVVKEMFFPHLLTDKEREQIAKRYQHQSAARESDMINLPDIEVVSAKVHESWMASKLKAGVTTRKLETGEELMVPYADLSEEAKELDRATVRTIYSAIYSTVAAI